MLKRLTIDLAIAGLIIFSVIPINAQMEYSEIKTAESDKKLNENESFQSCQCVAFRLDDVQGFWLAKSQTTIIETFQEKNLPLTLGVIAGDKYRFGEDTEMKSFVKKTLHADRDLIEIANHGWEHESFPTFDRKTQSNLIKISNNQILEFLDVSPKVFIPPFNDFNDDTLAALEENNFTHYSSMLAHSEPPFAFDGLSIYHFPETATTGKWSQDLGTIVEVDHEETFEDIKKGLESYGFAVVTMHPQEFAVFENGTLHNQIDEEHFQELDLLIDKIQKSNLKIVLLSQINQNVIENLENQDFESPKSQSPANTSSGYANEGHSLELDSEDTTVDKSAQKIPDWVKNIFTWYGTGQVSESELLNSIKFLITERIIQLG